MQIIVALIAAAVVIFACATAIAITRRICESKDRNTAIICGAVVDVMRRRSGDCNKMN
jgi:hypothetical protein